MVERIWIQGDAARTRLADLIETHRPFLPVLILFLAFRLPYLLIARPHGYWIDNSDYHFYLEFARLSDLGRFPYLHFWLEYPPVFPWLAVLAYKLNHLLPYWQGDPLPTFRLVLGGILVWFEVGNLCLIYLIARRLYGPDRAVWCGWVYSALFVPVYTLTGWFDNLPLFFLLLGVYCVLAGRLRGAALSAGLGFMVKIFPLVVLPVALRVAERRRWPVLVLAAAVPVLAVSLPFLVLAPQYFLASFASMASRSPWETIWAVAEGYYGYGMLAPVGVRDDPSTAFWTPYVSALPWPLITAVFGVAYLATWRRMGVTSDEWRVTSETSPVTRHPSPLSVGSGQTTADARRVLLFAALSVIWMFLGSKGYSPQFLAYLLPFILLALPDLRGCFYAVVLTVLNIVELPLYYVVFPEEHAVLVVVVVARTAILAGLAVQIGLELYCPAGLPDVRRWAARGASVLAAAGLIGALAATGAAWSRTAGLSPDHSRIVEAIVAGGPGIGVVVTDGTLYRDLVGALNNRVPVLRVAPDAQQAVLDQEAVDLQLKDVIGGRREVWQVTRLGRLQDFALVEQIHARGRLVEVQWEGTTALWRWQITESGGSEPGQWAVGSGQ